MRGKTVEIFATFIHESEMAVLINDDGGEENTWVPKSQIQDLPDSLIEGETYTFTMSEWIATEKGLI
jgi:hypothetical protein